ncbi:hypothetical protein BC830DRAFT_653592 [Chytriomyces sp. MP71]|nr:hypothetical protein BC830DRAFT_653592 [Chytriomyces sp. MP71]
MTAATFLPSTSGNGSGSRFREGTWHQSSETKTMAHKLSWRPPPPDAPLRRHLLYYFVLCSAASLIVAEVIGLGFIGGSINSLSSTASSLLTSETQDNLANAVLANAAQIVDDQLNALVFFVTFAATALGDTFRDDYSTGPQPSFYAQTQFLANASAGEARYPGIQVSLSHSAWALANNIDTTPPTPNGDQARTQQATSKADPFLRTLYAFDSTIHSFDVGFSNGFFRTYPGQGEVFSQGPYDPTTRPWYTAGANNRKSNSSRAITAPFLSAFGYGWIMGISKAVFGTEDGRFVGVVEIPTQLKEFSKILKSVESAGPVDVYTADMNGYLIASTSVDFTNTSASAPYSFLNSTNPTLITDFWANTVLPTLTATIINTDTASFGSAQYQDPVTGARFMILWKTLTTTVSDAAADSNKPCYVALTSVPLATLTDPVSAATAALRYTLPTSAGLSLAAFAATLTLLLLLVVHFGRKLTRPLEQLTLQSAIISNNIGAPDLFAGVAPPTAARATTGNATHCTCLLTASLNVNNCNVEAKYSVLCKMKEDSLFCCREILLEIIVKKFDNQDRISGRLDSWLPQGNKNSVLLILTSL